MGGVPGALLIFKSGQHTGDYHNDMNADNYENWLKNKLIPNLPSHSVLVIDNAPYHNKKLRKVPNSTSRKAEMIEWLKSRNIPCTDDMYKAELYNLINLNKPLYEEYYFDSILQEYGHSVVRLPPYHPELNPMELIWARVKNDVAAHNIDNRIDFVQQMVQEKFSQLTTEDWRKCCEHVIKCEKDYLEADRVFDMQTDELIIRFDDTSDNSDVDSESSHEEDPNDMDGIRPLV